MTSFLYLACQEALDTTVPLCSELGFPVAPKNVDGPRLS